MMSDHFHALIMAGGKGERFWPWSREKHPKQLLPLFNPPHHFPLKDGASKQKNLSRHGGERSLVEMTVNRLLPLISRKQIWIVTNATQAKAMARRMPHFPKSNFIIEPIGRDSAGAVMLGCATIAKKDPHAVMALLPADHLIKDTRNYLRVLGDCFAAAAHKKILLTIGIKPREASCAYGYIERGEREGEQGKYGTRFFPAKRFMEKPGIQTALRLVKSGHYYWNAGMFIWSAHAIHEAFKEYSPVHAKGWRELQRNKRSFLAKGFFRLPKISIDYAIMEKAKNLEMAIGSFDWDDVGSWSSLEAHLGKDPWENCASGHVIMADTQGCLVFGGEKLIATLGLRDLVIVQTRDATLVCHRSSSQKIKEIVKQLPKSYR